MNAAITAGVWVLIIAFVVAALRSGSRKNKKAARSRLANPTPQRQPAVPKRDVVVKTVKGNGKAERVIRQMLAQGYELDQQSSRKVWWTPVTGVFTRKQKHTLTFIKQGS
jgi:hypothetical protein